MKLAMAKGVFVVLVALLAGWWWIPGVCEAVEPTPWRSYKLYQPDTQRHVVYQGQFGEGKFAYNHCASIEHFDGKFHVVWQANYENVEGFPGRRIYWATSDDAKHWSPPSAFVCEPAVNPVIPSVERKEMQSQPNLLNYHGKELWCIWSIRGFGGNAGAYLSRLKPGETAWANQRIFAEMQVDGRRVYAYPSQNPCLLRSGRVLAPVTMDSGEPVGRYPIMYNAFLYTDDDGATWDCSNMITLPNNITGQWEPCVHQQANGKVRALMRNFSAVVVPPDQWLLTCLGTGVEKGEVLRFDPDAHYSYMESANTRMHCIRLASGRYVMFFHDVFVRGRGYETRRNGAVFFSRTGEDDFVAGPGFTEFDQISAYPQGVEHDGKIYVAYTLGGIYNPRSILVAVMDSPEDDVFYLWPRDKDYLESTVVTIDGKRRPKRTNPKYQYQRPYVDDVDGRKVVVFKERGTAGVETDPVDFAADEVLHFEFEVKIDKLQPLGNLILCSFGDQTPIRIGMPSNRPGRLYAYGAEQWQDVGALALQQWVPIKIAFGPRTFNVQVGDAAPVALTNPMSLTNRRLYLGDGYEIDGWESNRGSEFYIDLAGMKTRIAQP